jgi:hypothetical protein
MRARAENDGVGQLSDALSSAGKRLEARYRTHAREMAKDGLGPVFPQSWRFETESEAAVLRIDERGRVSVLADVIESPAVIVQWSQSALVDALLSGRSNERPRDPPPTIRFTSDAGRKAFSMLGTSLSL